MTGGMALHGILDVLVVYVTYFLFENGLLRNPIARARYDSLKALPTIKKWDSPFRRLIEREAFRVFETLMIVVVFIAVYPALPFTGWRFQGLLKGITYAGVLIGVECLPAAFYMYARTNYPKTLLRLDAFVQSLTRLAIGVALGIAHRGEYF